jgi:hypothetical protein
MCSLSRPAMVCFRSCRIGREACSARQRSIQLVLGMAARLQRVAAGHRGMMRCQQGALRFHQRTRAHAHTHTRTRTHTHTHTHLWQVVGVAVRVERLHALAVRTQLLVLHCSCACACAWHGSAAAVAQAPPGTVSFVWLMSAHTPWHSAHGSSVHSQHHSRTCLVTSSVIVPSTYAHTTMLKAT